MSFELIIKCTKDISNLHIDFADGTSSIIHSPDNSEKEDKKIPKPIKENKVQNTPKNTPLKTKEEYLDTNYGEPIISEKIELPKIDLGNREVKVANELQNLQI